ncbi:hypothetical protein HY837_03050 [archaeon]|nr:hypothetical protein [archaeon]
MTNYEQTPYFRPAFLATILGNVLGGLEVTVVKDHPVFKEVSEHSNVVDSRQTRLKAKGKNGTSRQHYRRQNF